MGRQDDDSIILAETEAMKNGDCEESIIYFENRPVKNILFVLTRWAPDTRDPNTGEIVHGQQLTGLYKSCMVKDRYRLLFNEDVSKFNVTIGARNIFTKVYNKEGKEIEVNIVPMEAIESLRIKQFTNAEMKAINAKKAKAPCSGCPETKKVRKEITIPSDKAS